MRTTRGALFLVALAALTVAGSPAGAQEPMIEEESITEQGTLDPFFVEDDFDLQKIFAQAEALFVSAAQAESIPLFDRLIARLETDRRGRTLPEELQFLLLRSRFHRAEAYFNLGDQDSTEKDLRKILEFQPGWTPDPELVSPKLVDLVERLRGQMVGDLLVLVEPFDATVTVDGRRLELVGRTEPVLAGDRALTVFRPGFERVELATEVTAGRSTTVELTLERVSAVVRMRVEPPGATVLVDGMPAQATVEEGTGQDAIAVEGLQPGSHALELRLEGHRSVRSEIEIVELADYQLPAVTLAPARGEIRLSPMPEGSRVTVNGDPASPRRSGNGATLSLTPGDYDLEVRAGAVGGFRSTVSLADRQVLELTVDLQPTIAFLGVLGSDRLAAAELASLLEGRLEPLDRWTWIDRSTDATPALDAAGLTANRLRGLRADLAADDTDWAAIQRSLDASFEASLYLLAVLGDDLYATTGDLWLWSPAPWPAVPTLRSLPLSGGGAELKALAGAFGRPPVTRQVALGARLFDSSAAAGPVVASVATGGHAATAGLLAGEQVLSVDGKPVAGAAALLEALAGRVGREVILRVGTTEVAREVALQVVELPTVASLTDPDILGPVLAAQLSVELLRTPSAASAWVLKLNQAAVYLRGLDFRAAVPLLRTVGAPETRGLGQAMADYWLGLTLLSVDPVAYADAARAALERALAAPDARLYHHDGPLIAPRARARLVQLDRQSGS